MTITLGHALAGVFVSALVLLVVLFLAVRTTRTVFPVRCAHCWANRNQRETVVTFAEEEGLWAICPDCVGQYWRFSEKTDPPG